MAALRQARGGKCEVRGCRATSGLEFAHLRPTGLFGRGRGSRKRYFDIKKHPDCYKLTCGHHHRSKFPQPSKPAPVDEDDGSL